MIEQQKQLERDREQELNRINQEKIKAKKCFLDDLRQTAAVAKYESTQLANTTSELVRSNASRRSQRLSNDREKIEKQLHKVEILNDWHVREELNNYNVKVLKYTWADSIFTRTLINNAEDVLDYLSGLLDGGKYYQQSLSWEKAFASLTFAELAPKKHHVIPQERIPEKPNIDQIKHRYNEWHAPFSNYHKEKFDLSTAELAEYTSAELVKWEVHKDRIIASNKETDLDNEVSEQIYNIAYEDYIEHEKAFEHEKQEYINSVQFEKQLYLAHNADAIADYVQLILRKALYPTAFPYEVQFEYSEGKALIVEYLMPSMEHMPQVKETRYLKTKSEHKPIFFKESELAKMYDDALYKITLRTLYIIFYSDEVKWTPLSRQ